MVMGIAGTEEAASALKRTPPLRGSGELSILLFSFWLPWEGGDYLIVNVPEMVVGSVCLVSMVQVAVPPVGEVNFSWNS